MKLFNILLFGLALLVLSVTISASDQRDDPQITWKTDQPLSWSDFKGKPDQNTPLHAYSMVGIKTDFVGSSGNQAELTVIGYFDKTKSWVKDDHKTGVLLAHEQLHFDLCEIYRRKLRKTLAGHKGFTYQNFSAEANRIFQENFQALTKEQQRYDRETQHSKLRDKQEAWAKFIDAELLKLQSHSGQTVVVQILK